MSSTNKIIRVAATAITNGNRTFATQRGYGELRGYREFPRGKTEAEEAPEKALRREIKEELDAINWLPSDEVVIKELKNE